MHGDKPHDQRHLLIGKLADVHVTSRITLVQSPGKEMRQLVELPELPLSKRRISTATNCGWILVILLKESTLSEWNVNRRIPY